MKRWIMILSVFWCMSSQFVLATTLTNAQIFRRCHAFLTQRQVADNHPLLLAVKSGANPITKCMELLNLANLHPNNGRIMAQQAGDYHPDGLLVLDTMNKLHQSWFGRTFDPHSLINGAWTMNIVDNHVSYHLTKQLFSTQQDIRQVVIGMDHISAIRDQSSPFLHLYHNGLDVSNVVWKYHNASGQLVNWDVNLVPTGRLVGLATNERTNIIPYVNEPTHTNLDLHRNWGGGTIGESPYFLLYGQRFGGPTDGGLLTHRRLIKNIMKHFFCRDLPALRPGDASSIGYLNPNASGVYDHAFRKQAVCASCHATMDEAAGAFRHLKEKKIGQFHSSHVNPLVSAVAQWPTNLPSPSDPTRPGNTYHREPPRGVFNYRSYEGELKQFTILNRNHFGQLLSGQKDFHACLASRYFKYFTGIGVDLSDIGMISLNSKELEHRNYVTETLRPILQSQGPKALIQAIFSSSYFQTKDFGVGP